MSGSPTAVLTTPHVDDLGLERIVNRRGLSIGLLPNGAVFSLEHAEGGRRIVINQASLRRSPAEWGALFASAARIRRSWPAPAPRRRLASALPTTVSSGRGAARRRFRASLWLAPDANVWLWRLAIVNRRETELPCDALFVQDPASAIRVS